MPSNLVLFPNGVQQSDRARDEIKARVEESERLRVKLLDREHTSEIYGIEAITPNVNPDDLMPPPDEVEWGGTPKIIDDMKRNVPFYGALQTGIADIMTSLPMVCLAGMKGDAESELAREEVWSAWENFDERKLALHAACGGYEAGFVGLENVWDVQTRGKSKGLIAITAMIDRPNGWFGFDYRMRPHFKRQFWNYGTDAPLVDDFKVSFLRHGSLHTRWGIGTAKYSYPAVWRIDNLMKMHMTQTERFGYMPVVVTYPSKWAGTSRLATLRREIETQWKNVLMAPGDVEVPKYDWPSSNAAYAAANATGASIITSVSKLEYWLSMYLWGSQYSSPNQQEGSYARDQVADGARLYKAPYYAGGIEAMLNRHFVRPMMLVNRPTLDESKWPRFAIDTAFGSDLELMLRIMESGAKLKIPISTSTWSDTFKVPLALPGEAVLEDPTPEAQPMPDANADGTDAEATAAKQFSEGDHGAITVTTSDGRMVQYRPTQMVWTENRGTIMAKMLQAGDVPIAHPRMIRAAS